MNNKPLVSVTIPTYNSEKFIDKCLKAIKNQSYKNIEINIIDGGSKDNTVEIARRNGIKNIYINKKSLLSARYEGVLKSHGEFVLLLDSDQVLNKNIVERCVSYIKKSNLDMLILEEKVYSKRTILEKLFHLDKKLVHSIKDFNPYTSVLLPRFYRRSFLQKILLSIPKRIIEEATPQDHAILYLESWKKSKKIGMLDNSLEHIEPSNFFELWKKFYRWGFYSARTNSSVYDGFFKERTERFRKGLFKNGLILESFASVLLLLMKGVPYKLGYLIAKINRYGRI